MVWNQCGTSKFDLLTTFGTSFKEGECERGGAGHVDTRFRAQCSGVKPGAPRNAFILVDAPGLHNFLKMQHFVVQLFQTYAPKGALF